MRRRDAVAILLALSLIIGWVFLYLFPDGTELATAWLIGIAVVFKSALLSFAAASKLKFIAFVKGLTLFQGTLLIIKRWFLDNVFSVWLREHIFRHLKHALNEAKEYYLSLDIKKKTKNIITALLISAFSFWFIYMSGYLTHIVLFAELKVLIISISKTLLLILSKILSLLFNSWLTPILEIFAFSWIFDWLERKLGPDHPVNRGLRLLSEIFGKLFKSVAGFINRYLDPLFNKRVSIYSRKVGRALKGYIENKKIEYEYEQFDRFEKLIMNAHINAYFSFEGMEKIKDKKQLYSLINKKTADGINIIGFVSRDDDGELVPEEMENSFYNDIFILEGIASSHKSGVKKELPYSPDSSDFWILNTSLHPAVLKSKSGTVPPTPIEPQSLKLVKLDKKPLYKSGDIYVEYNGKAEKITFLEDI